MMSLLNFETGMSDEVLVSSAKSGDTEAFAELTRRHARKAFHATFRITRNHQDAEDALQDSLLRAFTHIKTFEQQSSFSTWLTRIAINSALMKLRKKRACNETSIDNQNQPAGNVAPLEFESTLEDPESHCARRERERIMRKAILRLPRVSRDAIRLKHGRECSILEIAEALGISVAAVKSRLARARTELRSSVLKTGFRGEKDVNRMGQPLTSRSSKPGATV